MAVRAVDEERQIGVSSIVAICSLELDQPASLIHHCTADKHRVVVVAREQKLRRVVVLVDHAHYDVTTTR